MFLTNILTMENLVNKCKSTSRDLKNFGIYEATIVIASALLWCNVFNDPIFSGILLSCALINVQITLLKGFLNTQLIKDRNNEQ